MSADGEEEDEDAGGDESPVDGDVMMSIFASYYGIEAQPASPTEGEGDGEGSGNGAGLHREHKSASDIDSVHFNPEGFVRVLLDNAPIDELLSRDTQMTHEIRALDSDMQMLVYENYNKFISATETIKRMKSNVDAMDGDMDTVRSKMALITASSASLDQSLEGKRQRVDKLVRVRRLLERLEFLSELPEKLASMIAKEQYQRAVQLYRRTIHVLTQHAQVLSFRKIKERTEAMMGDLRGRVTDLLADPALEAVQLTQYASTLRLMEAPRAVVCDKLLQAHKVRSLQMVKRFTASSAGSGAVTTASHSAPSSSSGGGGSSSSGNGGGSSSSGNGGGSSSRSNGAHEDEFTSGSSADHTRRFHQDLIVGLVEVCRGLHELYAPGPASLGARPHSKSGSMLLPGGAATHSSAVPPTPLSLPKEAAASPDEIRSAAAQFRALLEAVLPAYKACLVSATAAFFERFNAHTAHHAELEVALRAEAGPDGAGDKDGAAAQAVRAAQLQHYALDDERQAWVTLVRQTIMDVQFLDREAEACVRELRGLLEAPHQESLGAAAQFSGEFSLTLLFTLDQHLKQCLDRRMGTLAATLPESEASVALEDPPGEPSHATAEANKRNLAQRTDKARQSSERLADLLMSLLGDLCGDAKEIVDVHSAVAPGSVDEYVLNVVGRFVTAATQACEAACGVCADMSSERATCRASDLAGNEAEVRGGESFGLAARVRPDGVDFAAPAFSAVGGGVRCLLLYSTLSGLRPTLAARLERELSAHGLAPGLSLAQPSRLWAEQFDDAACRVLARYVEHHASSCAALARGCVLEVLGGGGGAGKVGPEVRTLVLQLDRLTAACCVSLGESLAQFQKLDEYTRRGVGHRSNQRNNNQLQLNIDRLFAQRVSVFPLLQAYSARAGSSAGVLELVVGTVLKATVKAAQETLRGRTVRRPEQQQQLVLDLSFLRKCSGSFLPPSASRPAHDVELFHEQLVATLASRNGGQPGVVGINAIQSEVVAEAIKAISALTIVI